MAEWSKAPDCKSVSHWFESSCLLQALFGGSSPRRSVKPVSMKQRGQFDEWGGTTTRHHLYGFVAQSVEQRTLNPSVLGSSPSEAII